MPTIKQKLQSQDNSFALSPECAAAFRIFGDMPTLAIIFFLSEGSKRFNELERLTGTNPVTLTTRLKRLTEQNIVKRTEHEADKQSVSYSLGSVGEKTLPILQQIEEFSKELPPISID
jgi:DNA-binding HxlR family transcriptional regulator